MIVYTGNHPQMALIQVSELLWFTQIDDDISAGFDTWMLRQASHSRSLGIVANNAHDFQIVANKAVDSVPDSGLTHEICWF